MHVLNAWAAVYISSRKVMRQPVDTEGLSIILAYGSHSNCFEWPPNGRGAVCRFVGSTARLLSRPSRIDDSPIPHPEWKFD
jgi:hypothetical protein